METLLYAYLFIVGLIFGSFGSVVIYRLKGEQEGIITGRSGCGGCNRILQAIDLIPVISWMVQKGKCRKCASKISGIYPFLEISTGILFASIGCLLIDMSLILSGDTIEMVKLFFWLTVGFITILYTFYDILFMEIHEGIMLLGICFILFFLELQTIFTSFHIIESLPHGLGLLQFPLAISAVLLTCACIGGLYAIMTKGLREIWDILILAAIGIALYVFALLSPINILSIPIIHALIGALIIFLFFFAQILVSKGKWMGGGDLRIAILAGLLLGMNFALPGLMAIYFVGSIIGVSIILISKLCKTKKNFSSQVPFGPFIALGTFLTLFYREEINLWIQIYF